MIKDVPRMCPRLEVFRENKAHVLAAGYSKLFYCAEMNFPSRQDTVSNVKKLV